MTLFSRLASLGSSFSQRQNSGDNEPASWGYYPDDWEDPCEKCVVT